MQTFTTPVGVPSRVSADACDKCGRKFGGSGRAEKWRRPRPRATIVDYGQGMSVAAEQALVLRDALAGGIDGLALRLFRRTARTTAAAWHVASGADLAYPEVEGDPTLPMRLASRYVERMLCVAEDDPEVARRFAAVIGLAASRSTLFTPRVRTRVLRRRTRITAVQDSIGNDRKHGVAQYGILADGHATEVE